MNRRVLVRAVVTLVFFALASWGQTAQQILTATGVTSGLCVHVGCGDGSLTLGIHNGGKLVVQGLTTDRAQLAAARKSARSAGVYGLVSFDFASSLRELPYKDNLATLVLVDPDALGAQAPSDAEILRVVHPDGVAYVKRSGQWNKTVKPFPSDYDSWPFWDHGPDGNALSNDHAVDVPRGFQWMSGWDEKTTHSGWNRISGLYLSSLENRKVNKVISTRCVVRNSFNGIPLWSRANVRTRGPHLIVDDKVLVHHSSKLPMVAYNLSKGDTAALFTQGATTTDSLWGIMNGAGYAMTATAGAGIFVQASGSTLYGLDVKTGGLKWTAKGSAKYMSFPVADTIGKRVFVIEHDAAGFLYRWPAFNQAKAVACFDLTSGALKWRVSSPASGLSQLVYNNGYLAVIASVAIGGLDQDRTPATDRKVALLDAGNGAKKWERVYTNAAYNGLFRGDTLYLPGPSIFRVYLVGTGDTLRWNSENQGCMRVSATPKHLQFGHLGFLDGTSSGNWQYSFFQRPSCASGVFPANGMWYAAANPRCFCVAMYRTHQAWECQTPMAALDDSKRLTSGAAMPAAESGPVAAATPVKSLITDDWNLGIYGPSTVTDFCPNYFLDKELVPVSSNGIDYVVVPHEQRIEARKSGTAVWSYTAGGRITMQPLVHSGKVYFGCRDGYVYCLDGATGSPKWRFLGAANDRRIAIASQIESAWPIGNVVLYNNSIAFAAGLTVEADGGSYFWGLDPETGAIKWKFRLFTPYLKGGKGTRPRGVPNLTQPKVLTNWLESSNGALSMKWVGGGRNGQTPITRALDPQAWNGQTINIVTTSAVTVWKSSAAFVRHHGKVVLGDTWFEVPEDGYVKISRLSLSGRTTGVLYSGEARAGRTVFLNRTDNAASGQSVLKLEWSGGAVVTRVNILE